MHLQVQRLLAARVSVCNKIIEQRLLAAKVSNCNKAIEHAVKLHAFSSVWQTSSWQTHRPKNTPVNVSGTSNISATVALLNLTVPLALETPIQSEFRSQDVAVASQKDSLTDQQNMTCHPSKSSAFSER